jgi:hypothetical protein
LLNGSDFFGDDASLALKNLPADFISKIQVYDKQSDQAQFSGFNDGNSQKTINLITRNGQSNGIFGKFYAGYGTDNRYSIGGNYNNFKGNRRISIIGLSNNINQQNFSIQDILGVFGSSGPKPPNIRIPGMQPGPPPSGGKGGPPGMNDMANFFVGQQDGINTTNSLGLNYSDKWGKKLTISGSYFYNSTENNTINSLNRQYILNNTENQLYNENSSLVNKNYNHRLNIRLTYNIDSANSIIFSPRISYQKNSSAKKYIGINSFGDSMISLSKTSYSADNSGYNLSDNLLFNHKFSKQGRTVSLNIDASYNNKNTTGLLYSASQYFSNSDSFVINDQQSKSDNYSYTINPSLSYTEPLGRNTVLQLSYSPSITENSNKKLNYFADTTENTYSIPDSSLSGSYNNKIITQKGGVNIRYRAAKYFFIVGLDLQQNKLLGSQKLFVNYQIKKNYLTLLPSVMLQYRFSSSSNLHLFYRTQTNTPSVTQLQNVIDNSNTQQLTTGNPKLNQEYSHMLMGRFGKSNIYRGTSFFIMFFLRQTSDYIGNSVFIASKDTILSGNILLNKGSQLTNPVNLNNYRNFNTFLSYTFPIDSLKSNISINGGITYLLAPGLINDRTNNANTYNLNAGLSLINTVSKKLDFSINYNAFYNIVENSLRTDQNNNYFYQTISGKADWLPWKGLVISTDINYTNYKGLGEGYNQNVTLWNAGIGYKFLKDKSVELKFSVYDLLNQNNSITRSVNAYYIEDNQSNVLNRYFFLTLTYILKKFRGNSNG